MDTTTRANLASRLKDDVTYASLTNHQERIDYIFNRVLSYWLIRTNIEAQLARARPEAAKSPAKAASHREYAKVHQFAGNWEDALADLRKALLYADPKEESTMRSLYTELAHVQAKLDNPEGALWAAEQAIELAIREQEGVTGEKVEEKIEGGRARKVNLARLRAKYLKMVKQSGEDDSAYKFEDENDDTEMEQWHNHNLEPEEGDEENKKTEPWHTFLQYGVEIRSSAKTGRHFVATLPIAAETTILLERPYSVVLQKDVVELKCANCYRDLSYRIVPCAHCTQAVYCERQCALQHWADWHWAACGGILELVRSVGTFPLHVFQMITKVGGPAKALVLQAHKDDYSIDQYLADYETMGDKTIPNYSMSSILADHDVLHTGKDNVTHVIMGIEIAIALQLAHPNSVPFSSSAFTRFAAMICTDIRRVIYNVFGWTDWDLDTYIANCQCLVGSLVNHSCAPNTRWQWKDGVISFVAKRDIPAGEEVTISYGPSSSSQTYKSRQTRLNHYLFACACSACFKDVTTSENVLRCKACPFGPVVFSSSLNKEPHLNGRCLSCYTAYPAFSRAVRELNRCKANAKMADSLSLLPPLDATSGSGTELLQRSIELLGTIGRLSLESSEPALRATLRVMTVLSRLSPLIEQSLSLEGRLHLVTLLDQSLVSTLPASCLNGKVIKSLHFWFNTVIQWARELNVYDESANQELSLSYEPRDALHLVQTFHGRLRLALEAILEQSKQDTFLCEITEKQLSFAKQMRDTYEEESFY